ncbi:MAG: hypothetical protein IKY07_01175, partial [Clostridia bacterium]|nr:hypothetical protein [Clostridia bacterium]
LFERFSNVFFDGSVAASYHKLVLNEKKDLTQAIFVADTRSLFCIVRFSNTALPLPSGPGG